MVEHIDLNDYLHNGFFEKLRSENDRACAILAGVAVELLIENLLKKYLIKKTPKSFFEYNGPAGTLGAKIIIVYSFGLISRGEYEENIMS